MKSRVQMAKTATVATAAAMAATIAFSLTACGNNAATPQPGTGAGSADTGQDTQSRTSTGAREAKIGETIQFGDGSSSSYQDPGNYTITEMTLGGQCRYGTRYDDPLPEGTQLLQVWSESDVPADADVSIFTPPYARVVDKEGYTTEVEHYSACETPEEFDPSYSGVAPGEHGRYYETFLVPEGTKEFKLAMVRYPLKDLKPNTETPDGEAAQQEH